MATARIVPNKYPEKPVLPYKRTKVDMHDVVEYIAAFPALLSVKVAAYVMFRNESGNGLSGINNNYIGAQADNSRWNDKYNDAITGTCVKAENMTGKQRRFLCFASFTTSVDFLIERIEARGLFVGGYAGKIACMHINSYADWAIAYYKEWVTGNKRATPDSDFAKSMVSMCKQGSELFK